MKRTLLAASMAVFMPSMPASAEYHIDRQVRDQVAQDFATCAAYFSLASRILAEAGEPESSQGYKTIHRLTLDQGIRAAMVDRGPEAAESLVEARFRQALSELSRDVGDGYRNLREMNSIHGRFCTKAIGDPQQLVEQRRLEIENGLVRQ